MSDTILAVNAGGIITGIEALNSSNGSLVFYADDINANVNIVSEPYMPDKHGEVELVSEPYNPSKHGEVKIINT